MLSKICLVIDMNIPPNLSRFQFCQKSKNRAYTTNYFLSPPNFSKRPPLGLEIAFAVLNVTENYNFAVPSILYTTGLLRQTNNLPQIFQTLIFAI